MSDDFYLESYDYKLPESLIAKRPIKGRQNSRLLVYHHPTQKIEHRYFYELPSILPGQSCLVLNRSQVFPCRLLGKKKTGAKAELFILSIHENTKGWFPCLLRSKGKKQIGQEWVFGSLKATIMEREDNFFWMDLQLRSDQLKNYLHEHGHIPIPPYIRSGEDDQQDREDYQTVYAKEVGSVAAPTAGLHFTDELFERLSKNNIEKAEVTLHVGMGTFVPVKTQDIREHQMHDETYFVDENNLEKINSYRNNLIAVGTTSLRVLESSLSLKTQKFDIEANKDYETDIFLHPGKSVQSIQGLITNFHLPKSTLLMLVSALVGREKMLELYAEAIEKKYRFYSYGDAMCLLLK